VSGKGVQNVTAIYPSAGGKEQMDTFSFKHLFLREEKKEEGMFGRGEGGV
jgi:hypothetical protein